MRWLLAPLMIASVVGCHRGGAVSSPSAPDGGPAVLTFVSGETQQPVAGARVVVAGQTYTTDASGRVVIGGAAPDIDVEAPEFLERRALPGADAFSLWPRQSPTGLDEEATARMVYGCAALACGSGQSLVRLAKGEAVLVPSPEIQADVVAMDVLEEAARQLSSATNGQVTMVISTEGARPGIVTITVGIDPQDPVIVAQGAGAVTRRQVSSGSLIRGASILFRSLELARRLPLALHELGHAFGLSHSARVGDMMWNGPEIYNQFDYSARERLAMALMLQRTPGNRYPDDGRGAAGVQSTAPPVLSALACVPR